MSVFIGYPSFMAYQMMKGKKGNNDGFPSIPGIVARYSASGLTNEQMVTNPVWVDKTGNGHDLQMKNFAWGGMSGVGGYVDNWISSADWGINNYWVNSHTDHKLQFITASTVVQVKSKNIYNAENVYKNILKVNGLTEAVNKGSARGLRISATDSITSKEIKTFSFDTDGVIQISFDDVLQDYYVNYFVNGNNTNDIDITIEQLPLYPGALVFDGVDDYGVCENFPILTKGKGYTVVALRQWDRDFLNTILTGGLLSTRNYSTGEGVAFEKIESLNKGYWNLGAGGIIDFAKSPFTWQTSKQYNNVSILKGDKNHGKPLCVGCGLSGGQHCGRFAIWELVFLDHDATEEELTKIKDYFVKTYPWLFPDQAWTVTGKTNEDEDRATIANITGNGNDLVLSNLGFAEGSGYGLYGENYNGGRWVKSTDRADITWTSYSVNITSVKVASTQLYYQSYPEQPSFIVPSYKIKVYGLKDGQTLSYKQVTSEGQQLYKISEDGTYTLPSFPFKANGDWYGFTLNKVQESCDITIEQIPEYEGYLVTDGVDDEISSAKLIQFADKFTIVGDWKFMEDRNDNAGLLKANQIYIYNATTGMRIYLKQGSKNYPFSCKKINALTSDGWAYDEKWDKYKVYPIGSDIDISSRLFLGFYGSNFTKIALKNLGIYNDQLLSKDDCIKAYNYLQTLKAK
nr:MAG TPA: hypothetical protein [Caudoviricetes sp.]